MNDRPQDVLAHMDKLGVQAVRDLVSSGRWPANYYALATAWLRQKDAEEHDRNKEVHDEVHRAEAYAVALRSSELAHSATVIARESDTIARSAQDAATNANKVADEANFIAREAARAAKNNTIVTMITLVAAVLALAFSITEMLVK